MQTIRPATDADAPALQALFALTLIQATWMPEGAERDTNFQRNSQGEAVHVCIAPDGSLLGFVAVYVAGAFIHHLYVSPLAQGQGVGRALIDSMASWLPKPWRLKCVTANAQALDFYLHTGWQLTDKAMGSQGEYAVLRQF